LLRLASPLLSYMLQQENTEFDNFFILCRFFFCFIKKSINEEDVFRCVDILCLDLKFSFDLEKMILKSHFSICYLFFWCYIFGFVSWKFDGYVFKIWAPNSLFFFFRIYASILFFFVIYFCNFFICCIILNIFFNKAIDRFVDILLHLLPSFHLHIFAVFFFLTVQLIDLLISYCIFFHLSVKIKIS
jgi:hypothetical protein